MLDLARINSEDLRALNDADFEALVGDLIAISETDRKENSLLYYQPVSDKAMSFHKSMQMVFGLGGGNGSSKSETALADMIMSATGVIPDSVRSALTDDEIRKKCTGPMQCRVVVASLKNMLHQVILPKLKWWVWTGMPPAGGPRGHYGWVPRACLIQGAWEKSWVAGRTTLEFYCKDPFTGKNLGVSTIQFLSSDMESQSMAGGDLQYVIFDEVSTLAIWRENLARVMRGGGRIRLAMTWPDDPAIPVDWVYDEIYDKVGKDKDVGWVEMDTRDNTHLDQESVSKAMTKMSKTLQDVRIKGRPLRLSNLIHPLFTDIRTSWCFSCMEECSASDVRGLSVCAACGGSEVASYCHVEEIDEFRGWPAIFVLDPHPRKPHMFLWALVDPQDDIYVIAEGECASLPADVAAMAFKIEHEHRIHVTYRLIDPKMGQQPCGKRREISWRDEFSSAGLHCELADSSSVGRSRVNEYLMPDCDTYRPRLHIHPRCHRTIYQMKRYCWDEYRLSAERDPKHIPKQKNDDYPTMLKYLLNFGPRHAAISGEMGYVNTRRRKRGWQ